MPRKFYIDTHKGITFLVILGMIAAFNQWQNATAWIYLALHGTYGILWVLKSRIFPDRQWEQPVSVWRGVLYHWGGLTLYWVAPYLLTSRGVQATPWFLALAISIQAQKREGGPGGVADGPVDQRAGAFEREVCGGRECCDVDVR